MERVARLMERWAGRRGEPAQEVFRWRALGYLHDVLREAPPQELRPLVPREFRDLPPSILHGPAGAELLRKAGVDDREFLEAVTYHTLGHPGLGAMGRCLYAADFLEPGRKLRPRWRAGLRRRMPDALEEVVEEIVAARIAHLLRRRSPIRPETSDFWNALVQRPIPEGGTGP